MKKLNNKFHFSVDDVFESLIEVSDKKIPLSKHWFFKILYKLWKKYKIRTAVYLFYQKKINGKLRTLKEIRDIKNQLKEGWLYFNIHGLDYDTPPYSQKPSEQKKTFLKIHNQIIRFAGKKNLSSFVRLHYYSESFELKNFYKQKNIYGLFVTDREVGSYRLPKKNSNELILKGITKSKGVYFIRTDYRVEFLSKIKNTSTIKKNFNDNFKKNRKIIIYTHENELKKKINVTNLINSMKILVNDLSILNAKP